MTTASARTSWVDWVFRSREDGRITVVQWPNAVLWAWVVLVVVRRVWSPSGGWGTALSVASSAVLLVWAALEVKSGVNPFRRALGAVVALVAVAGLVQSLL